MPWSQRPLEPWYLSCVLVTCASLCQSEDFPISIKLLAATLQEKRGNSNGPYCQWWSENVKTQRHSSCESITGMSYIHTPLSSGTIFIAALSTSAICVLEVYFSDFCQKWAEARESHANLFSHRGIGRVNFFCQSVADQFLVSVNFMKLFFRTMCVEWAKCNEITSQRYS